MARKPPAGVDAAGDRTRPGNYHHSRLVARRTGQRDSGIRLKHDLRNRQCLSQRGEHPSVVIGVRNPCEPDAGGPDRRRGDASLSAGLLNRLNDVQDCLLKADSQKIGSIGQPLPDNLPILINDRGPTTRPATIDPKPVTDFG